MQGFQKEEMKSIRLFNSRNFLLATRDSGYKNFASAIAELIDNSFEAKAKHIEILIQKSDQDYCVGVLDDGEGMDKNILSIALQFGGSTRFNSRSFVGRYGMGLPNSSLSHSRRVDVFSWQKKSEIWWSYLDLDEILKSKLTQLHVPEKIESLNLKFKITTQSGTLVRWSNCDRLRYKHEQKLLSNLHIELGNLFRKKILSGCEIRLNDKPIKLIDPTFFYKSINGATANVFGEPIKYKIKLGDSENSKATSEVLVTFTQLPIERWYSLSNEEKQLHKITKKAGVSIVRAGREIDYGWFFMGTKRKENYDDWWRCEISFEPKLDELFGVTHIKQEIHPTDELISILTPDLETTAKQLNRNVRERFLKIKAENDKSFAQKVAEKNDFLLVPPRNPISVRSLKSKNKSKRLQLSGIQYKIISSSLNNFDIFHFKYEKNQLTVLINEKHPFFMKVYSRLDENKILIDTKSLVELLIFGHARAESAIINPSNLESINMLRREWSNNIANYLQSI